LAHYALRRQYQTYVKVAGRWGYVYRAIDEYGQVIEVLFREHRDTEAATAYGPKTGSVCIQGSLLAWTEGSR
jgi:transposase-like protein